MEENIRLKNVLQYFSLKSIKRSLGKGRFGEAFLTNQNTVLKLTIDKREFITAKTIQGLKLNNIVNVISCSSFKALDVYHNADIYYGIHQEYLNTEAEFICDFVKLFKSAWFSNYFETVRIKSRYATFEDLEEYMVYSEKYLVAIDFTKEWILNRVLSESQKLLYLRMYDDLLKAYKELKRIAPLAHIDLNEGNLGFTEDGVLKIFDVQ